MIPVLLYHSVGRAPSSWVEPFTVAPEVFRRHLEIVAESGRQLLTVSELRLALDGRIAMPARPAVLTFDDGFADLLDVAAPLLARHAITASVYLTTGFVDGRSPGGDRMISWAGLRDLQAAGHEIGGHSVTHPQLDTLSTGAARREITACRDTLQDTLGRPVESFAYPHGYSDARVRRLVAAAGFTSACAVRDTHASRADPRYALSRLMIRRNTSTAELRGWLDGTRRPTARRHEGPAVRAWRSYRRTRAVLGRVAGHR
ncbi:polysaccharide deacetylase family protein [Micromonosporaceae bacterium Da 78-11]